MGQVLAEYQYVGYSGTGSFTQSGGTNATPGLINYLYMGYDCNGTNSLSGGEMTPYNPYVGYARMGNSCMGRQQSERDEYPHQLGSMEL